VAAIGFSLAFSGPDILATAIQLKSSLVSSESGPNHPPDHLLVRWPVPNGGNGVFNQDISMFAHAETFMIVPEDGDHCSPKWILSGPWPVVRRVIFPGSRQR
jgi:hypothetical protein